MLDDGSSPISDRYPSGFLRGGELVGIIDAEPETSCLLRAWLEKAGYRVLEHSFRERAI